MPEMFLLRLVTEFAHNVAGLQPSFAVFTLAIHIPQIRFLRLSAIFGQLSILSLMTESTHE